MTSDFENQFCDAVEILVNQALNDTKFDRTYPAIVKDVKQSSDGIYQLQYQDSIFSASVLGSLEAYAIGDSVYVLVPGDDWTQEKKILGYTDRGTPNGTMGIDRITNPEIDEILEGLKRALEGELTLTADDYWISSVVRDPDIETKFTVTVENNSGAKISNVWSITTNSGDDTIFTNTTTKQKIIFSGWGSISWAEPVKF